MRSRILDVAVMTVGIGLAIPVAHAAPPTIYSQSAYESPVHADPNDLLLLPGNGFAPTNRVVYQKLTVSTQTPLTPPSISSVPSNPNANLGFASVVSVADVAHTLTIQLPSALATGSTYALWVIDANGEWSNGFKINDARPLWVTPDFAHATAALANLPRTLKVVGRNLQPVPSGTTRVQLIGPVTYTLTATTPASSELARYTAEVSLPATMAVGTYSVQVSRDGVSWVPLLGLNGAAPQTFQVGNDPTSPDQVYVHSYTCAQGDDTTCIVSAINEAGNTSDHPNGASVIFDARNYTLQSPGTWSTNSDSSSEGIDFEGIKVPNGVNLMGAGVGQTVIACGTGWLTTKFTPNGEPTPMDSLFNLQGNNIVQGITFADQNIYTPSSPAGTASLLLGNDYNYTSNVPGFPRQISHVTITDNEFRLPFVGILSLGLPIDHLLVTDNTFGAYQNGMYISGGSNWAANPFHLTDSVIAYNTFYPSSFAAPPQTDTGAGVIATQLGGGTRLDFSHNTADGSKNRTTYLYSPSDPTGFRAGFFWNLGDNSELKLISQNSVYCSGDKPGDGEAIAFDSNSEQLLDTVFGGFVQAANVVSATSSGSQGSSSSSIVVNGAPVVGALGFQGQWLQLVAGTGLGQLRKIVSVSIGSTSTTVMVAPAFDVLPDTSSQVVTGLQNWQAYILDNLVEHGTSDCADPPKTPPSGGIITFYAQTADSVIAGNQQNATSGILLAHQYILDPGGVNPVGLMLESSNEVRANVVNGRPLFADSGFELSGLRIPYVAQEPGGQSSGPVPPVMDFGLSLGHNQITQADDAYGAIEFARGGDVGYFNSQNGCVATWELLDTPLVFQNSISQSLGVGIANYPQAQPVCSSNPPWTDPVVWHAVLANNACSAVSAPAVTDKGTNTKRVCATNVAGNSCECAPYVQGYSAAPASAQSVAVTFSSAQSAGNTNVVVIGWGKATALISSVADSVGNQYALAAKTTSTVGNAAQAIYVSTQGIAASAAGGNTVTVTFTAAVSNPDVRIAEYTGIDPSNAVDVVAGTAGSGNNADSGWVTTTNANDLLLGANYAQGPTARAGADYTLRLASARGDILEDWTISETAAYHATAPVSSGWWVAQLVALRLAGGGDSGSAQGLTAPSGLIAVAASNTQINLQWSAASDSIGVTGYLVERCSGANCQEFAQVGSSNSTSFADTSLKAKTSYSYRVRATDVANLNSAYSSSVSLQTP